MQVVRTNDADRRSFHAWLRSSGIRFRDVCWAVVVVAAGSLAFGEPTAPIWERLVFWGAVVILGSAVLIRNSSTSAATALAVLAGVLFVITRYSSPATVTIGYVLIFAMLGASRERLWRSIGAFGIVAGGFTGAAWVARMAWPEFARDPRDFWSVVGFCSVAAAMVCLVGYVIGLVQRQRAAAAAVQVARAEQHWVDQLLEQERERSRLAREMHDVVAHSLAVIVMQSQGARYIQDSDPDRANAALETIGDVAREALTDVRILLGQLRAGTTSSSPARDAATNYLGDLVDRLTKSGCVIRFDGSDAPPLPDWVHCTDATRALPELLINAAKHGDDSEPITLLHQQSGGRTTVTVSNLIGSESTPFPRGGHGLVGLRELLFEVDGTLYARAESGWWLATVVVPDRPNLPEAS